MLTNSDLQKIGNVVDERLKKELDPIKKELIPIKKQLNKQGKDIKYLRKTLDLVIDHFDNRDVKNRMEMDKIKQHIGLTLE